MVRRVRISCDEIDGLDPTEPRRDTFDDLDDLVLDAVLPEAGRRKPADESPAARRRRKPTPDVRRHLADADWLRDAGRVEG